MRVTRRRFIQGAGATALVAGAHVLALPRRARAALPVDPVVVLVELSGGNDALNTVVPLNNVGAPSAFIAVEAKVGLARTPSESACGSAGSSSPSV